MYWGADTSTPARRCDVTRMKAEESAVAMRVLHIVTIFQCGGFLLRPSRHILFLNSIAVNSLGNGLMVRENRLVATHRASDARLQSSIELMLGLTESVTVATTSLKIHRARTHRSLKKDSPISRPVQRICHLISHPILGGLHCQYVRI